MIRPSNKGIRFNPNSYHKVTMTPVNLSGCAERHYIEAIECPMYDALVYTHECEACAHGKAGNYKEKWVKCDFPEILAKEEFEVLKDVVAGVHKEGRLDNEFGNWVDI